MRVVGRVIAEFVVVTVVCLAVGLAANAASSRGLKLSEDYFRTARGRVVVRSETKPTADPAPPAVADPVNGTTEPAADGAAPVADGVEQRLALHGLQAISHEETVQLFEDPAYGIDYVFVDARNDRRYAEGHVPGAFQVDHYYRDRYMDQVLPFCMGALKVVVYCSGGDCEDSEFVARGLIEYGVDPGKIFVYPGGMEQWRGGGMPVETGGRGSGIIR